METLLTRTLSVGSVGIDVDGIKRTVYRGLDSYDKGQRLKKHMGNKLAVRRTYGTFFASDVNRLKVRMGWTQNGKVEPAFFTAMSQRGYPDALAVDLLTRYAKAHPRIQIYYPFPYGEMGGVCQGLHETAGIDDNWAIDFCARPHTTVVAVEAGTITKLSGRSPNDDTWDTQGVYGWSVHFLTNEGYRYYVTHFGYRQPLSIGMRVEAGDTIGKVGDQRFRPDHVHYGCSSPRGDADAKARITAVSKAPRII